MSKSVSKISHINEFYSYPAWVISLWLGVCLRTAKRYKAGQRVLRPALRLFTLVRDRRVLLDRAWDGWLVDGERLCAPSGESVTPAMLNAWFLVYQERDELRRERDRVRFSGRAGSTTRGQTYRPSQAKCVCCHADDLSH